MPWFVENETSLPSVHSEKKARVSWKCKDGQETLSEELHDRNKNQMVYLGLKGAWWQSPQGCGMSASALTSQDAFF